jgi:hypothetical protein
VKEKRNKQMRMKEGCDKGLTREADKLDFWPIWMGIRQIEGSEEGTKII